MRQVSMGRVSGVLLAVLGAAALWVLLRHAKDQVPPSVRDPVLSSSPAGADFIEGPPSLRWILRGSQLLVNGKWILDPATGQFRALPYATTRALQGGGIEELGLSLSWDGERVVLWERNELRFGPVDSVLSGPIAIPRSSLNPRRPEDIAPLEEDLEPLEEPIQVLFWVDKHQLVLYQLERVSGAVPACSLFDTAVLEWEPLGNCPQGDFREIAMVLSGPDDWIAVYSAAEGTATLRIAQYELEQGPHATRSLGYDMSPGGNIQAQFSLDGTRIDFATDCLLHDGQTPCRGRRRQEDRWRLYSWLFKEEKLTLVREGLPPHFVPAPGGRRLAWLSPTLVRDPGGEGWVWVPPDRVCVGETTAAEQKRCFCLPTADPGACKAE